MERINNILEINEETAKSTISSMARQYKSMQYNYHYKVDKSVLSKLSGKISNRCRELLQDNNSIFRDNRYIEEYDNAINTAGMDKGTEAEKLMIRILNDNFSNDFQPYFCNL
jgi:hypothetical protein